MRWSGGMGLAVTCLIWATGLLAAARFAVWPARTYRAWWVALFATELGHAWAVVAVLSGAAAVALILSGELEFFGAVVAGLAAGLAGVAGGLFARPALSAARVAAGAAHDLGRVFGAGEGRPLWSWVRLWRWPVGVRRGVVQEFEAAGRRVDFYPARRRAEGAAREGDGAPLVVLVHGGGWDGGDRRELAAFDHWLAERGVAVLAFDYRLAPEHRWPAQREDLREVLAWARENATRLGVDAARITLVGRSAGAQIAVATAYGERLPGVRAVVALYGVHDLEFVWSIRSEHDSLNSDKLMRQYLGGPPEGARRALYHGGSGEALVHAEVPPTLIVHGALDEMVWCRHSEKLASALRRVGAPHVFVRLPWATHAGEANLHGPAGQLITGAVAWVARAKEPGRPIGA